MRYVEVLLAEAETYDAFDRVDVTIDVNGGNPYASRLRGWQPATPNVTGGRVRVRVAEHGDLSHPFRLTWAHRQPMQARLDDYDWFLYAEGDVLVTRRAMAAQLQLAARLHGATGKLLGFARMVTDRAGRSYFSDVRGATPSPPLRVAGLAPLFATLDTAYAGAWAYPASLMRRFVASPDWMPQLRDTVRGPGLRERAAFGWRSVPSVTVVDEECSLCVYHLGKSGDYYPGNVRGHNVLPMHSLVTRAAAAISPATTVTSS